MAKIAVLVLAGLVLVQPSYGADWKDFYAAVYASAVSNYVNPATTLEGPKVGLTAGWRHQVGGDGLFVGAEIDWSPTDQWKAFPSSESLNLSSPASIRAVLGVPIQDWLLYVSAGPAIVTARIEDWSLGQYVDQSRSMVGFALSVGADVALTETVFARTDISFSSYRTIENFNYPSGIPGFNWNYGMTISAPEIRAGIGIRW